MFDAAHSEIVVSLCEVQLRLNDDSDICILKQYLVVGDSKKCLYFNPIQIQSRCFGKNTSNLENTVISGNK